ncbi:MAG: FecR domain-containing protein [Candidatus Rokubacteria bacterium]|nr:FecR domain-containing protein [Candidatus Rokubacteria bacterium]
MRLRRAIAVLLLVTSWPTLAWGTTGVVTALEGTVTVTRTAAQPRPLGFKDEIRPFDSVATSDRARARLLLAGAAAVTMWERSALTLTEVPGRSTVQLESGTIALAVARERLAPGETIVIRAPTATATLREGVVIAEVTRWSAQAGAGRPAPVTAFSVVRGVIEVQHLDPVTQAPLGPPVTVGARARFTVAGGAPARVEAIPPEAMAEIASGLGRWRPQHTSPPNQDQLTAQAMATAVALATALVEPARAEPPSRAFMALDRYVLAGVTGVPLTPLMGADVFASPAGQATQLDVPEIAISGASLTLPAGQTLKTFTGTVSWTSTAPVVAISDSTLTQTSADVLLLVDTGATVSLTAPLLDVTNSTLLLGQNALFVLGTLASTTTAPLISLDPTTVLTPGAPSSLIRVESGGSLALAGPVSSTRGERWRSARTSWTSSARSRARPRRPCSSSTGAP